MQDHPGAPGTARQESTRTIVSTNDGGNATQPRAPGHERPRAAPRAARHGRLSAATGAPGADVPPATTAGAPGQHCLSAVPRAPGHERPRAAQCVARHGRLSAAPIATVSSPAGVSWLRQVILPRTPATPNTLTYSHSRSTTNQVHPATQVPPRPRSCSTACTGFPLHHHSRAPPAAAIPLPCQGGGRGVRPAPRHSRVPLLCALCVLCGKRAFREGPM